MASYPDTEDHKVYNSKMGYMMDVDLNERMDEKVKKILKDTELGEELSSEDEEDIKYAVFDSAVFDLVCAVKEMYCEDDDYKLDKCIDILIEGLKKMKGKEAELRKMAEEDEEEDEKAGGEAHKQEVSADVD